MANTPTIVEINCETGETVTRPYTADELVQFEKDQATALARQEAMKAEETEKAELKASALAKLAELGLTEDEAKAIAG